LLEVLVQVLQEELAVLILAAVEEVVVIQILQVVLELVDQALLL
jgi:hypothetical protein